MSQSKLINDFKILREHCILLRRNFNTYTNLYTEENRDILNISASTFFTDIAEIMHRDWILQACKLMDNARMREQENISIKLIDEQLGTYSLLNPIIISLSQNIITYGEIIKPMRNKMLAHFDRKHHVERIPFDSATKKELFQFLDDIQRYCDEVGWVIGIGPLDFSCSNCSGDEIDLIQYLKRCRGIDKVVTNLT